MGILHSQEEIGLKIPEIKDKTIFFAVLNWGIGHATRSIPIIQNLLDQKNQVIILSDGEAGTMLQASFPNLIFYELPSYNIHYSQNRFLFISIMIQSWKRRRIIEEENAKINSLYIKHEPEIVISDNRYGCYHHSTKNYIISHQLKLISRNPLVGFFSRLFAHNLLKKYHEVWIPDMESVQLSAAMSNIPTAIPKRYIGFPKTIVSPDQIKYCDTLILLSGPEPRRSQVEKKIHESIQGTQKKVVFIAGNFIDEEVYKINGSIHYYSRLTYHEVLPYIAGAKSIICRSGYTTLIDLYSLQKSNITCIPTKGQPEQEFLARYWAKRGWIDMISEDDIKDKLIKIIDASQ